MVEAMLIFYWQSHTFIKDINLEKSPGDALCFVLE